MVPEVVTKLLIIEERMVSPYIPFMQIKALQPYAFNSQLSLKGSVVNIATDINEMIQILPRSFDELSIIQIKLKRHIDHKSDYMFETIKPSKICEALKYLQNTPLYKDNEIKINEEFFTNYENNNNDLDFIIDEADIDQIERNSQDNNLQILNKLKSHENIPLEPYELNDEVLVIDNNKRTEQRIEPIIIAPGQDKSPLPWHKIKNLAELCFPRIFGGYPMDKLNKLTYGERVLSEVRRKDRRSRYQPG
uniref:DUF6570 domain-containing protein n=1 Tax=Trichogramma kaykai TaxID=54128 RepID=A0ABD2WCW2_9HYME